MKVVFVTGGSRGIGRGIAERLIAEGYLTAVGYRKNKNLCQELTTLGGNVLPVQIDLECSQSINTSINFIEDKLGTIDILINNAGIAQEKPFMDITDHDWQRMLKINLWSNFALAKRVIPNMQKVGWGRLIQVSSIGGQWGGLNQVHYAAAKAGQINLTRSLAKIYSAEGITSNAVAIGLAQTDMSADEVLRTDGKEKIANIPIKRLATVEEIGETVLFLCSGASSYVTGQTINLNGGMYFV